MQRVVAYAGAAVLIGLIFIALWSIPVTRPASAGLLLHYLGTTNDPQKGEMAIFSVTNVSSHSIAYTVERTELLTPNGWVLAKRRGSFGFDELLQPGGVGSITCPVPSLGAANSWRVVVRSQEEPTGVRGVAYGIRVLVHDTLDQRKLGITGWESHEVYGNLPAKP